jgi:O-antigen ligase
LERALVYPLGVLAALLLARRANVRMLLGSVLMSIVLLCAYALATKLLPERLGISTDSIIGHRLATPLGYWNALGIFAALGTLLALGFAARAHATWARGAGAAALVVLAPTLYLTFSRGAWISLIAGTLVAIAVDRHPLQLVATLLVAGTAPALAVLFAARSDLGNVSTSTVAHDGHRIALLVAVLMVVAAIANVALASLGERIEVRGPWRRIAVSAILAAALGCAAAGTVRYGSPPTLAHKVWRAFNAPPPTVQGNFNQRLFNLSGSGRSKQYRAAFHEFERQPLAGSGAGTYELSWLKERPLGTWQIRDAHSLYVETLGELGIVGLALLVAALAMPLVALRRARRHPLASTAAGAYVAYLLHAGFDWDWEMTAVTLAALLCGVALLRVSSRNAAPAARGRVRAAVLAATAAVGVFATVGLVGNTATAKSARAVRGKQWTQAMQSAATARTWAPWSAEPLLWLGEAQVGQSELAPARRNLRAAIEKDPGNWQLWFDLALASPRGGVEQRHSLAVALELNPLSPEVREFMAGTGLPMSKVRGA